MCASSAAAPALAPDPVPQRHRIWLWAGIVATFAVAVLGGIAFWLQLPLPPPQVVNRTQITHDGLAKTNVLSDGTTLYLSENSQSRRTISKVPIDGSKPATLALPFAAVGNAMAPDRSSILLSEQGDSSEALWSVPLTGGAPRRLQASGRNATWAPDGKSIAYVHDSALWVASADGGNPRQLTDVGGTVFYPRFSPDGRRIRFSIGHTLQNSATSSLWEVGADGSGLHALFEGWHDPPQECCGSWTPDGRYYIFQVSQSRPANVTNLWALVEPVDRFHRKTAANPIQLTSGPMSFAMASTDPMRSGKLWALGVEPAGEFVKYDLASRQLVSLLPGVSGTDLDFSRDGKWVAYVAVPQGTLWRSRTDGSDRLELSKPPQQAALPRWSPDGK